jgi:hydantoinase/carbamoylase family amidase
MTLYALKIDADRLHHDFEQLSKIGATPAGGVTRPSLSLEDLEARAWFADQVETAGFMVHDDDAGNLSGVLYSPQPNVTQTLLIGSHLDTVPNGGRYDGAVGVLAALEVARTLKEHNVTLPFHLEVINFTDEEGTWVSLLGSRGLTGRLALDRINNAQIQNGALRAALSRAGIDVTRLHLAQRNPADIAAFLELHIEQGDTLEQLGCPVGVVTGIVGRTTHQITFIGERGHSGTTSIYHRKDALQGAAAFVTGAHTLAQNRYDGTIVNCGGLEVYPGTFNVIPERAKLLVECRHVDENTLLEVEEQLLKLADDCAGAFDLRLETQRVEHMDAARMDERVLACIEASSDRLGLTHTRLASYAGHDAQPLSHFTPSGMIFIPSQQGTSHNPKEFTDWPQIVDGANLLLQTVITLAERYPNL